MSASPGPGFNAISISPVPSPYTPPPTPEAPSERVVKTVELSGSTIIVRGGSPEVCPQVRARNFQVLSGANAQGELSRLGRTVNARVDRDVILGRCPSPGMFPHAT